MSPTLTSVQGRPNAQPRSLGWRDRGLRPGRNLRRRVLMTAATIPGLDTAPTKHKGLLAWVQEVAELTQPDRVVFADGSDEEYQRLCDHLVAAGTFTKLSDSEEPS